MIQCRDVFKCFEKKNVLNGIDLDIPQGQIFGLLGPSGAGKTTLIKIITGQLKADKGEVFILGKSATQLTGKDTGRIGIMMDSFGMYERLSCAENLSMYADIYRIPRTRVKETLASVGLGDAAGRAASNLSKGMGARLQLARVFLHSPEIMFLDEPTSGLDPQSMRAIHRLILDRRREGCTIFLTTHNMEEATALCDKVALLNEGKIVEYGEPQEICRRYNHQKRILLHLTNGTDLELPHDVASAETIGDLLGRNQIETMHSSEPTLETVFLELTGRTLQEEG
ncbi:MAG: ABC transporter ATP-binding protein [Lachnospiraceae bacterium]|nr:ABC transporter ATP-binding protein [Lachnospiraceae bacterium]